MKIVSVNGEQYALVEEIALLDSTEQFEFLTDIHLSYNGVNETRYPLRNTARQTLFLSIFEARNKMPQLLQFIYDNIAAIYLVPQIMENEDVTITDNIIYCDTSRLSLSVGNIALITDGIENHYVIINEVNEDNFVINEELLITEAQIIPLRRSIIEGSVVNKLKSNLFDMSSKISFKVMDNVNYTIANIINPQNDVYSLDMNSDNLWDVSIDKNRNIVDGQLGLFVSIAQWQNSKIGFDYNFHIENKEQYLNFKRWFYRRMGRLNSFLLNYHHFGKCTKEIKRVRIASDSLTLKFIGGQVCSGTIPLVEVES